MTTAPNDRSQRALLEEQLRCARMRVDSASPGGPEFDAAMAGLEALEARLLAAVSDAYEDAPPVLLRNRAGAASIPVRRAGSA